MPGLLINDDDHSRLLLNSRDHEYLIRNEEVHWIRDNAPDIDAFSVSPRYLIDSAQSAVNISATAQAAHVSINENVDLGTSTTLTLSQTGNVYTATRPTAPISNASYVLNVRDNLNRRNHRTIKFYRWLTPTVAITFLRRTETHTGVVFRQHIVLRITRTGTPLPELSLASSQGTSSVAALNPNTAIGNGLSADITIGRTRPSSNITDRITLTGTSSLPIATTPTQLTATSFVDVTWLGTG